MITPDQKKDPLCVCGHKRSQHAYGSRDSTFYGRPPAACLHIQRTPNSLCRDICKCETYTEGGTKAQKVENLPVLS